MAIHPRVPQLREESITSYYVVLIFSCDKVVITIFYFHNFIIDHDLITRFNQVISLLDTTICFQPFFLFMPNESTPRATKLQQKIIYLTN